MPSDLLATSPDSAETRRLAEPDHGDHEPSQTRTVDPPVHSDLHAERFGLALAIVITAVHALVRLDATPLWLDEGYTLGATNDLWSSLSRTHGTMGLYYVIMWVWAWFGDATWWLRLPSVLFAVTTLCLLRPIARRVGGSHLVAIALPVAALLPMFQAKAVEARSFALLSLITCACWYVLIRALDAPDTRSESRWFLLLVPLAVAGVFSHGLFVVHLAALGSVLLLGPTPWRRMVRFAPVFVAAMLVTYVLHSLGASGIGTMVLGGPPAMLRTTLNAYFPASDPAWLVLLLLFVAGVLVIGRQMARSTAPKERAIAAVPLAMSIVPCIVLALGSTVEPRYSPRYLAPIGLGIALVVGVALIRFDRAVRDATHRPESLAPIGAVSIMVLATAAFGQLNAPLAHDHDWRGAASLVAAEGLETDGIIFANHSVQEPMLHRVPFEAAWREVDHGAAPAMVSPPRPLGEVLRFDDPLSPTDAVRAAQQHRRIWVIEHQVTGLNKTEAIVDGLVAKGYEVEAEHSLRNQISLVLLSRQP